MSSTERAPEPTMEEILASIRRIISDDEQNSAAKPAASTKQQDDEALDLVEGEADDKIISDIARVLSSAQQTPAEEEEEDILDLTSELGGLEIVEEEEVLVAEVLAEPEVIEASAPEMFQPAPAPEPVTEAAPEPELELQTQAEVPEAQAEIPEPAPAPEPAAPMSASEEAASALERAIAALRAGQLPTSISEFAFQPQPPAEPAPQPEPPVFTAPETEPTFQAEPEPEPTFQAEPDFAPEPELEPEPELVLAEFEAEAMAEEPVFEEEAPASEPEAPPAWESETPSWAAEASEPERATARTNGHSADEASEAGHKSLEDSIKDMLRPMLQRWLDENMPRMVTAALQDELRNNPARFERD